MPHNLASLSFAEIGTQGQLISLWISDPKIEYTLGCREGRRRADEVLAYMREEQSPLLLNHVIAALIQRGIHGAIETGFLTRVAELALAAEVPVTDQEEVTPDRPAVLRLVSNRSE